MWLACKSWHMRLPALGGGALLASVIACSDTDNDAGPVTASTPTETTSQSSSGPSMGGQAPAPQSQPTVGPSAPSSPAAPALDPSQNGGASTSGGGFANAGGSNGGNTAASGAGGTSPGGAQGQTPTAGAGPTDSNGGLGGLPSSGSGGNGNGGAGNSNAGNGGSTATGGSLANGGAPVDDGRGPRAPTTGSIEVLYDGNGFDAWTPLEPGLTEVNWLENGAEGWMEVTPTYTNHIVTNDDNLHRDIFLHLEFRSPNEDPAQMGQDRGNSGIYLQSRYEVQILDSYGNAPGLDTCGAIYELSVPLVNACNPAEEWNTYEISFTAPTFEGGQKVADARITAWLNDQLVQDDVPVPGPTRAGEAGEPDQPLPLYLQDHGDTVRFRNIWWIRL